MNAFYVIHTDEHFTKIIFDTTCCACIQRAHQRLVVFFRNAVHLFSSTMFTSRKSYCQTTEIVNGFAYTVLMV